MTSIAVMRTTKAPVDKFVTFFFQFSLKPLTSMQFNFRIRGTYFERQTIRNDLEIIAQKAELHFSDDVVVIVVVVVA